MKKMNEETKCDIILPVCDQYEFTKACIESIIRNTDTPYRLIVINNGKNPETRKFLDVLQKNKDMETTIVHNNQNIGWVKALNKGMELSSAPYVCFQNDDTIVTSRWLRKMIRILELQENFGMINPNWEGRAAGVSIDSYNSTLEKNSRKFVETDWCRGFSVVIKRAVIEKIGKVDEIYGLAYFDDVDYSVTAIEAGFICLRALDTYVYHHRNVTFFEVLEDGKWNELHEKNKFIYYKKWGRPLKVVLILNKSVCKNPASLNETEDAVFYLARKQHHVDIWCPQKLGGRFLHTNVRLKNSLFPPLWLAAFFDLYMNRTKRDKKKYDAIFSYDSAFDKFISRNKNLKELPIYTAGDHDDFNVFIKETVDSMKEKTKEEF